MFVLGLETSGQPGSVAIVDEQGVLARSTYAQPNMHAEHLLPHIEIALRTAGCERHQLDKIVVGTGPGNFTGLRVGIALASGLGLGLGRPVVGVCSLASVAAQIAAPGVFARFVIRDARRGEVFCAAYASDGESLVTPSLVRVDQLFDWLTARCAVHEANGKRTAVAGDGLQWLTHAQKAALGTHMPQGAESISPDAQYTARIGFNLDASAAVVPVYVRDADAVVPTLTQNTALTCLCNE